MTKRKFECRNGRSEKFWTIALKGTTHTVSYGRIGTDGQEKSKSFESHDKAKAEVERVIRQKLNKGYVEIGGKKKVAAKTPQCAAKKTAKKKATRIPKKTTPKTTKGSKANSSRHLITISLKMFVFDIDSEGLKPTSDSSLLKLFDGMCSCDYSHLPKMSLGYEPIKGEGLFRGGYSYLSYDADANQLWHVIEIDSPDPLNRNCLAQLRERIIYGWIDGYGWEWIDESIKDLGFWGVVPTRAGKKFTSVEQTEGNAYKPRKNAKATNKKKIASIAQWLAKLDSGR